MMLQRCVACDPNDEHEPHPASVLVWQVGDEWVPSCADRVLSWWTGESASSYEERVEAGAPEDWIRPLGSLIHRQNRHGKSPLHFGPFYTLEQLVKWCEGNAINVPNVWDLHSPSEVTGFDIWKLP